ncbi:MAG TPA: ABC transporter ATP-binding protein [Blastocatellia bacterium]|nr:ABC transporter ATP-binding protein [Blastocatellia bacterium]
MRDEQITNIIELENVSKDYTTTKTIHALRSISLTVKRGERVALMGPSGSGKSTLLNLICGLDKPTLGAIRVEGIDLSALTDDLRTRLRRVKIGMIFQSFNLLPTLSTIENVSMPLRLNGASRGEAERTARAIIEKVGLVDRQMHRPDELSGGERQRVAIARALIFRPPLLLADEPTGNLDSTTGEEVLSLLDELHREYNTTLLLVTHNALAAAHCDRIVTLLDGSLSEQ